MAGIYVHIPFCRSKCAYCGFYSGPERGRGSEFAEALSGEWEERRSLLADDTVTTVYIGGGTPSVLDITLLDRIIRMFPVENTVEYTIEANPEDITADFARWLETTPVNRVSLGVQSLDDTELHGVGRRHSAQRALEAIDILYSYGISNISADLIYGLPGQTPESWRRSLRRMLDVKPEHLSCYLLSYEPGTRLWAMLQAGKISEASEELVTEMYETLIDMAHSAGYEHYEISNFSLPGYRSVHNSSYWHSIPYLGLGPGAHSWIGGRRGYNPSRLNDYILSHGRDFHVVEPENDSERFNDLVITAMRTSDGLNLAQCGSRREMVERAAASHLAAGLMERTATGNLRIAERSWLIADRILLDFIEV